MSEEKGIEEARRRIAAVKESGETTLNLIRLGLAELPTELFELSELTSLNLLSNKLTQLPPDFAKLTQLQSLNLFNNQLTQLPPDLTKLTQLKTLSLFNNQLTQLPPDFASLTQLKTLILQRNQLTQLSADFAKLTQLKELDLSNNQLAQLPADFASLTQLETLDLSNNQLAQLPAELRNLSNLIALDISQNQLVELPEKIRDLNNLQFLSVAENNIQELPDTFSKLSQLGRTIQIKNLPSLSHFEFLARRTPSGDYLDLTGNSQRLDRLQDLWTHDRDTFYTYLKSLIGAPRIYETKLLLVGEGAVGKSSLLAALRGEAFEEERETTHGLEYRQLSEPHPNVTGDITFHAWDFGGQPVYRISHQFYYSEQALYLVLWEPRSGPDKCQVREWIERIQLRVGQAARILVVATHCKSSDRVPRIDQEVLQRDFSDLIHGFFEVDSSKDNQHGIEELKTALGEAAAALPHMGERFNEAWSAARDELTQLSLERPKISRDDVEALTSIQNLSPPEIEALLQYLHNVGDIVYFSHDEELRTEVVLDPEWLPGAVSLILEDPQTNEKNGILEHSRIRGILHGHGKEGQHDYEPHLHPFLLRLMEEYDVSYRIDVDGRRESLVGQLVQEVRPDLPWNADARLTDPTKNQVAFIWRFTKNDAPTGLIPWLIARTRRYAPWPHFHWQEGTFLRHPDGAEALFELRDRDLVLTVQAPKPATFVTILREAVARLLDRWEGLELWKNYEILIPCDQLDDGSPCNGTFLLKFLERRVEKNKSEVTCQSCSEDSDANRLLLGIHRPTLANEEIVERLQRLEDKTDQNRTHIREVRSTAQEMLLALEDEGRHNPRLFVLAPVEPSNVLERIREKAKIKMRLTLICEFDGGAHPVEGPGGTIVLSIPSEALKAAAPAIRWIAGGIKLFSSGGGNLLFDSISDDLDNALSFLKTVGSDLKNLDAGDRLPLTPEGELQYPQGAALHQAQALIQAHKGEGWGDLRRVRDPATRKYCWVCKKHQESYQPGPPEL